MSDPYESTSARIARERRALGFPPDTTAVTVEDADTIERDAWNLYLLQTRGLEGERYAVTEPWAWEHLKEKRLHARRVRRYDRASTSTPIRRSTR